MNRSFKKVAFVFFFGLGIFYLGSDFLLHQGRYESSTLEIIFKTFDMPFYFSAGMVSLAVLHEQIGKRYEMAGLQAIFILLGVLWTTFLLYLNGGYTSLL